MLEWFIIANVRTGNSKISVLTSTSLMKLGWISLRNVLSAKAVQDTIPKVSLSQHILYLLLTVVGIKTYKFVTVLYVNFSSFWITNHFQMIVGRCVYFDWNILFV